MLLTQSITHPDFRLRPRQEMLLLHFAVYFLELLPYFAASVARRLAYLSDARFAAQQDFGWMNILTIFQASAFIGDQYCNWRKFFAVANQYRLQEFNSLLAIRELEIILYHLERGSIADLLAKAHFWQSK